MDLHKEHQDLVKNLMEALLVGQAGFLRAGAILCTIKEKETFKSEDSSHEWKWADFIARPDLPFPGRTPGSRRRTADALIRIYKVFKRKFGYTTNVLAPIGWTKLDLLAAALKDEGDKSKVDDLLKKAEELTINDLAVELERGGMSFEEAMACQHLNAYQISYCPDCHAKSKIGFKNSK